MKNRETKIEIVRQHGELQSVSVLMPTWDKIENDNSISINIPLFGLKSHVFNNMDHSETLSDTVKAFCMAAEKYGNGLESELNILGWEFCDDSSDDNISMIYPITSRDTVIEQIMSTGETQAMILELA